MSSPQGQRTTKQWENSSNVATTTTHGDLVAVNDYRASPRESCHMIPQFLQHSRLLFIFPAIVLTIICSSWHGTVNIKAKHARNRFGFDSTFSRYRSGSYLISFAERFDNLTLLVDDILSSFPEVEVLHVYPTTKALAVENVSSSCLAFLQTKSYVLYIEPDFDVQAMKVQENLNKTLEWGIDRIDGKLDNTYHYDLTGKGVRVYVIDSGIRFNHVEFRRNPSEIEGDIPKSRARCGRNFRKRMGEDCLDNWGHGTHVAALIGMCHTTY
jgi:Subtilase family